MKSIQTGPGMGPHAGLHRSHKRLLAAALILSALAGSNQAFGATAIDELRDMPADGTLLVSNVAGSIEIRTWDREAVQVTGELGSGAELEIETGSRGLEIRVENEGSQSWYGKSETTLVLSVPVEASIRADGVSASISIRGSRGANVRAESVSGDVDVEARSERIELGSVSGNVRFSGESMRTSAESVSGDVDLRGIAGELEVEAVSGDVEVEGGIFTLARFESVSGSLDLALEIAPEGRFDAESMSGDIDLRLPADQAGSFEAETFSGNIHSQFGEPESEDRGPGTSLRHSAGDGRAAIRIQNFSGDIRLDKR